MMDPESALLVVDVQNDFCPGGALAVPHGDDVVPVLNGWIAEARRAGRPVFASRDWHPRKTTHFAEFGGPWPVHCVQGTHGAAFHPDLRLPGDVIVVTKGTHPDRDDYSAMHGTVADGRLLPDALRAMGIRKLYVGGLATDYCVKETVLLARQQGFEIALIGQGSRGVEVHPGDSERAVRAMREAGAVLM